uniref:Cytochrome b5 heme-binding domain-containing protein n=1 Tax=Helicotheca tamesis TaxID=374047 RepID=A0A7S2I8G2_9STRA
MVKLVIHVIWVGLSTILISRLNINSFFMRFFRDLARSKARRRLYGNKHALVPMLLGMDDPIIKTLDDEAAEEQMVSLTLDELSYYDGEEDEDSGEDTPIYLAIKGRVYDVSAGGSFYGPEGQYHDFVGKDATRAFATGCLKEECITSDMDGLNEKELKEIDRWIELYETHDKYKFVGKLVDDVVEKVLEKEEEQQQEEDSIEEKEEQRDNEQDQSEKEQVKTN